MKELYAPDIILIKTFPGSPPVGSVFSPDVLARCYVSDLIRGTFSLSFDDLPLLIEDKEITLRSNEFFISKPSDYYYKKDEQGKIIMVSSKYKIIKEGDIVNHTANFENGKFNKSYVIDHFFRVGSIFIARGLPSFSKDTKPYDLFGFDGLVKLNDHIKPVTNG